MSAVCPRGIECSITQKSISCNPGHDSPLFPVGINRRRETSAAFFLIVPNDLSTATGPFPNKATRHEMPIF